MKKVLLFSAVCASFFASAQTFTVNDSLSDGQSTAYYVMDSTAVSYAGTTGTGVTWNYSTLLGEMPGTIPNAVVDAAGTTFAANYPSADYNDDLSSGASVYFSNTPDSVISYGYVFTADGNDIVVKHNVNPLKTLEFPMSVGDTYNDYIEGEVVIISNTFPTTGSATVTCDGFGTLIVGTTTHSNVIRVKLIEAIDASITIPFPVSGTITRTVYSYFTLASDKQAIFVHATIDVTSDVLNDNYTAVYYSGTPIGYLGAEENEVVEFSVFPNPSNNLTTITTDGTTDQINVISALGQVVYSIAKPKSTETVDVSKFEAGVYIISIVKGDVVSTQKLIVE